MSIYVYACLVGAGMSEKNSAKEKLTAKALQYLRDHYMEPFSLDEIASALFVNKHYLSRVFSERTGRTLLWQHNELRCEDARRLLADPDYSIAVVAFRSGFTSSSHFSRIFRNHTGCTPSEYRRQVLK